MNRIVTNAAVGFCIAAIFCSCYNEIEPDPRGAGDVLTIAGAYNVRDIGGYEDAGGKHIKSGVLIRSGDLNLLTERDQTYLFGTLGIKTVVDFRSKKLVVDSDLNVSSEQKSSPDRLWEGVTTISETTAIDESIVVPDYESIIRDQGKDANGVIEDVKNGYKRIVTGTDKNAKEQYKAFFQVLLDSNGAPVLYHCSAGKDRTGIATALLLSALGVSREVIIEDYLKSADAVAEKYYPIVPFIVKSTREQTLGQQKIGKLLADPATEPMGSALLAQFLLPSVRKGAMQAMMDQQNKSEDEARAGAKAITEDSDAVQNQVNAFKDKIQELANAPYEYIEKTAQDAGEKVAPLLTVKREYIEAAFTAIEEKHTDINTYLKNEMGLSDADIKKLKDLYLE